jgi:uncharacterized protein
MPNPVVHFEIMGTTSAKTQQWYGNLFGWNIDAMPFPGAPEGETYGVMGPQDGKGIGGGIGGSFEGSPPAVRIYVEVDDPQAYLDKVEQSGGKTVMPVSEIPPAPGGNPNPIVLAMFADPDGNIIGLVKTGSM